MLLKQVENAARRFAVLELGSEWVREKILLCAFFVRVQGIIKYLLEVGGRGGSRVSMRHKGGSGELREKRRATRLMNLQVPDTRPATWQLSNVKHRLERHQRRASSEMYDREQWLWSIWSSRNTAPLLQSIICIIWLVRHWKTARHSPRPVSLSCPFSHRSDKTRVRGIIALMQQEKQSTSEVCIRLSNRLL